MPLRDVNDAAVTLVRTYEGIPGGNTTGNAIFPYIDPVNIWTIGWGHAIRYQNRFLRGDADRAVVQSLYPEGITMDQALTLLHADLVNAGRDVSSLVAVAVNDNQFGALTSFTFNLGIGNLASSTLLKLLNAGNYQGASAQFARWNMAAGKVLPGLVKRRAAEAALFLTAPA